MLDILFINPGDKKNVYQDLKDLSAYEPPFLTASFAAYLRNEGYKVDIIDANVLNLSPKESAKKAKNLNPKLVAVIVYGNQPSASTQNMTIAGKICKELKKENLTVAIGGLHPSALPKRTLIEEDVDFVIEGEEQIPLKELLEYLDGKRELHKVKGIWYYENGKIKNNPKPPLLNDLDKYLPIAAWDLLPMKKYKAHNWHCFENLNDRSYAAIYTSLGCPFKCTFCCINAPFGKPGIRYRSPELVVEELELLAKKYNIKNIKIIDEMFVLDERHYMKIVELLIQKNLNLNIWAYARVDTIKKEHLPKMKKAGFNWLCLGIESASEFVRDGAKKKIRFKDIEKIVKDIQNIGINVLANYIFGLPDDNYETMEETLCFAKRLNTEFANFYSAMAYPGSQLYEEAVKKGYKLPEKWVDYSQHSPNQIPLPTKHLSPMEVLKFRDYAWNCYFNNPKYLNLIKNKFGEKVLEHIKYMTSKKLKRNYIAE
jgi:anaerobic magnesium-protoporphyrin IX monomethyl ester cyclase